MVQAAAVSAIMTVSSRRIGSGHYTSIWRLCATIINGRRHDAPDQGILKTPLFHGSCGEIGFAALIGAGPRLTNSRSANLIEYNAWRPVRLSVRTRPSQG